jgi:hypothetical protein
MKNHQIIENGIIYDVVEYNNGDKYWYLNGLLHRENGPAVELIEGDKFWRLNGKLHRVNGPACDYNNGDKSWYFNDEQISCSSQEEFEKLLRLKAFW